MITDAIVVAIYFIAIFSIGIYAGRKQTSLEDYALGNRSLPWWAILASILAAEISAATFLGAPGEGFAKRNFTYAQLAFGTILGRIVVGRLFLKPYYQYNVVSIYEYLEKRFGIITRRMGSMVFLISRVLASGVRMYFAGILLVIIYQYVTGEQLEGMGIVWAYIIALTFITLSTTVYTAIGGLRAVVWTDVIQAIVLIVSIFAALTVIFTGLPNGWTTVTEHLNGPTDWDIIDIGWKHGASLTEQLTHILSTEYTIWAAVLGSTFITMATHGTDQDMVQRMLAGKSAKQGSRAVIVSGLIDVPIVLTFVFTGMLLYVFYQVNTDLTTPIKTMEVFPHFIVYQLPVGVRGLLIAGLLATSMGSLSTALNSLATTGVKDWYQDIFRPQASQRELLCAVRWGTVFFAVLLIVVGSIASYYVIKNPDVRMIPIALGIFGYTYGSLLGVFLLGMLCRTRGSDTGNIFAMAAGFLVVGVLSRLIYLPWDWSDSLPVVAFPWRITIGTLTTIAVGLCFKTKKTVIDNQ